MIIMVNENNKTKNTYLLLLVARLASTIVRVKNQVKTDQLCLQPNYILVNYPTLNSTFI